MESDLVELVCEASPRSFSAETVKTVAKRLRDCLCLGLSGEIGHRLSEFLGLSVPNVQCHGVTIPVQQSTQ